MNSKERAYKEKASKEIEEIKKDIEEINRIKEEIEEKKERIEELNNGDNQEEFKEYLNDNNETVNICGLEMYKGDILFDCDNIAFREMLNNYNDEEITQLNEEIDELEEELKEVENED